MNQQQTEDYDKVNRRACASIERNLGPELLVALNDPKTIEIMLNADGKVWQERLGEEMRCIGTLRKENARSIIELTAGYHSKVVTWQQPILEAEFPLDGSRFAGQLPPVVSSPTFTIRKKAVAVFTLEQYVKNGIMTAQQFDVLVQAIRAHKSILVSGGTGSGKTTLLNAVIKEMVAQNQKERVVIIEDTGEIQCSAVNCVQFHTTAEVSMTKLLKTTLRMRPDRILVGEVRGPEALDLLMAWNTGHPGGAATLHANDARAALSRMNMLISMHHDSPKPIEPLIGEAINILVHISKTSNKSRRIEEILGVSGYVDGQYQILSL